MKYISVKYCRLHIRCTTKRYDEFNYCVTDELTRHVTSVLTSDTKQSLSDLVNVYINYRIYLDL
jgi:hypothetical protein